MKEKIAIVVLCLLMLTGCGKNSPFVVTDEDYYKTHTGTTEENDFFTLEKTTAENGEQTVSEEDEWHEQPSRDPDDRTSDNTDDQTNGKKKKKNATDEQEMENDEEIVNCDLRTGLEVQAYKDSSASKKSKVIPAGEVLPILAMEKGYFKVSYQEKEMWVSEAYCLVNAKQYIPSIQVDLGMGNNPNFFNIGDESIPGVTNQSFYNRSGSQDGSEAWLRYGVVKQLNKAQKIFQKDGYSIKICDAYRPYSITIAIRDGYGEFLRTKKGQELKQKYFYNGYGEGHFLAQKASAHNYGVAIDMTLVDKESNEELIMPSPIHSLDARSGYKSWMDQGDTEASHAHYMKGIMEAYGFSSLDSEWWHFQVDTINRTMFDVPN